VIKQGLNGEFAWKFMALHWWQRWKPETRPSRKPVVDGTIWMICATEIDLRSSAAWRLWSCVYFCGSSI